MCPHSVTLYLTQDIFAFGEYIFLKSLRQNNNSVSNTQTSDSEEWELFQVQFLVHSCLNLAEEKRKIINSGFYVLGLPLYLRPKEQTTLPSESLNLSKTGCRESERKMMTICKWSEISLWEMLEWYLGALLKEQYFLFEHKRHTGCKISQKEGEDVNSEMSQSEEKTSYRTGDKKNRTIQFRETICQEMCFNMHLMLKQHFIKYVFLMTWLSYVEPLSFFFYNYNYILGTNGKLWSDRCWFLMLTKSNNLKVPSSRHITDLQCKIANFLSFGI